MAIGLLRFYKLWISPLLPRSCRFSPTCSEYAQLSVRRHGVFAGALLTVARLFRCNPFAAGGIDLPPDRFLWSRGRTDESAE